MIVSVVVCTNGRPGLLRACLESLVNQTMLPSEYEIIVIDNAPAAGSETEHVVKSIEASVPVRYFEELREGLSHARNRGIGEARGDIVAFIDDDAIAEPDWLDRLSRVYEGFPDAWVVGGRIELWWEVDQPSWLLPDLYGYLGRLDHGSQLKAVLLPTHLGGGNFSAPKTVLEALGGFSPQLGRNRKSLLSGEETEFLRRVQVQGGACYYCPDAVVRHFVPRGRLTQQFFRSRIYWQGRSEARTDLTHCSKATIAGRLARACTRLIHHPIRIAYYHLRGTAAEELRWKTFLWGNVGYLYGLVTDR